MRVKAVQAEQPRLRALLSHEVNRTIRAPGCLVVLARNVAELLVDRVVILALRLKPVDVGVAFGPVVVRVMAPVEDSITVIDAGLDPALGRGQMEFPGESAIVSSVGERLGDEWGRAVPEVVAVHAAVDGRRIHASEESGAAGRADWRLAVSVFEGNAARDKPIDVWRADVLVSERANGVPTLLVGADPQYVRARVGCRDGLLGRDTSSPGTNEVSARDLGTHGRKVIAPSRGV